uniref:Putative secreted protein n=1 Tax=Ixodes ricinus TaxID=34613 RepID=A0A6B0UA74_IXORI
MSNDVRKSAIFLMLPLIISMYSRLAQSCCICFWIASLSDTDMLFKNWLVSQMQECFKTKKLWPKTQALASPRSRPHVPSSGSKE